MGWYFTDHGTYQDLIAELTCEEPRQPAYQWSNEEQKSVPVGFDMSRRTLHQALRHESGRDVLWTVEEHIRYTEPVQRTTHIGCYLLARDRNGWDYKPMDESMAPYYYSCPLEYLDMAPEVHREWRQKVMPFQLQESKR